MKIAVRVVDVVGAVLFLLSVIVQGNDPDPALWMLLYGAACASCVAGASGKAGRRWGAFSVVVAVVALAWAATLVPSAIAFLQSNTEPVAFTMKTGNAAEEEARECGGLLLVVVFMALNAVAGLRASRSP